MKAFLFGLLAPWLIVAAFAQTSITIPAQTVTVTSAPATCVNLNTTPVQTLCGPGLTVKATTVGCTTAQPAANTQTVACPTGTIGSWTQTRAYVSAPAPTCWTAGPWAPISAPSGACAPVTTVPPGGLPKLDFVIYQNGSPIPQDDSWAMGSVNYADTTGQPMGGKADIAITLSGNYGGWQPLFVPNGSTTFFDLSPYNYLLLSIKPAADNASYWIGFAGNLDTPDGSQIEVAGPGFTAFGPAVKKGVWGNYKIPLTAFKMTNAKAVFKFGVADGTGLCCAPWFVDSVGLTKN